MGGASLSLVGRGAFEFAPTFGGRAMGRCWSMLKSAYLYIIWRAIGRGVGAVQNWRVCTHCYVLLRVVGRCVDAVHLLRKVLTSTLLGEQDG